MFVEFTILHLTIHIVPSMNHAVHQLRTGASSSLAGWSLHGIWFWPARLYSTMPLTFLWATCQPRVCCIRPWYVMWLLGLGFRRENHQEIQSYIGHWFFVWQQFFSNKYCATQLALDSFYWTLQLVELVELKAVGHFANEMLFWSEMPYCFPGLIFQASWHGQQLYVVQNPRADSYRKYIMVQKHVSCYWNWLIIIRIPCCLGKISWTADQIYSLQPPKPMTTWKTTWVITGDKAGDQPQYWQDPTISSFRPRIQQKLQNHVL